jgi:small subunit ribosomal protein S8
MVTDPISDLLTRIRNAALVRKEQTKVPYSKVKETICRILVKEGYLKEVKKDKDCLILTLAFAGKKPVISHLKVVSKPSLRVYRKKDQLPYPLRGAGIALVSTSQGIMTDRQARKKGLGGEVLAEIW